MNPFIIVGVGVVTGVVVIDVIIIDCGDVLEDRFRLAEVLGTIVGVLVACGCHAHVHEDVGLEDAEADLLGVRVVLLLEYRDGLLQLVYRFQVPFVEN